MRKRVLFVAYCHPDQNMGGVRQRRIARLLPRQGWDVTVLTHSRDETSVVEPTDGVRVVEVNAPDLTAIYRRLSGGSAERKPSVATGKAQPIAKISWLTNMINRWLLIPDKFIPWRKPAFRRGLELLHEEKYDAIFASLDPRTSLLVAADLSERTGVPCVLEYRDIWIGNPYLQLGQPTPVHRWLHRRLERGVLSRAARVSTVCEGIAEYLSVNYAGVIRAPVALNYNFFDPGEFPPRAAAPSGARPFVVSYTGAMYLSRNPHRFFEGMRAFIEARKLSPEQFRFRWAGGASGIKDLDSVIERTGVRRYMDFLGQIPHREALRLMMESDAALLLQAPDDAIHIPGKLFEALGARTPLLALAHPCEVTRIIERCRAGVVCPHTPESIAAALEQFEQRSRQGLRWEFNESAIEEFSADAAVARLARLFADAGR